MKINILKQMCNLAVFIFKPFNFNLGLGIVFIILAILLFTNVFIQKGISRIIEIPLQYKLMECSSSKTSEKTVNFFVNDLDYFNSKNFCEVNYDIHKKDISIIAFRPDNLMITHTFTVNQVKESCETIIGCHWFKGILYINVKGFLKIDSSDLFDCFLLMFSLWIMLAFLYCNLYNLITFEKK